MFRKKGLLCAIFIGGFLQAQQKSKRPKNKNISKFEMAQIVMQPWRLVSYKQDAIVQIFVQQAVFDWLEPYRSPVQQGGRASGFFIKHDHELLIVTNWHVVDQAVGVWIQLPSLGKKLIPAIVVSIYPDKDLAILKISDKEKEAIEAVIENIPTLPLGDSDTLRRTDGVLALGYPLGQESLKSTTGVISGMQSLFDEHSGLQRRIQMSAPINPGSSGGPLLNSKGEVVGITNAGIKEAQNTGYAIPINELKNSLHCMLDMPVMRRPYTGVLTVKVNESLTKHIGNPEPGGCYVLDVVEGTPFDKAGIKAGDMIYEVNGNTLDIYGDVTLSNIEDSKISFSEYSALFSLGDIMRVVVYRHGERKEFVVTIEENKSEMIKSSFPWFEVPDYELFAGIVVMELHANHIEILRNYVPGLMRYVIPSEKKKSALVITHIFQNSLFSRARSTTVGFTVTQVNGIPVHTLDEYREAIKESIKTGTLTFDCGDQISCVSDYIPVVLPFDGVVEEAIELSKMFKYPISPLVKYLLNNTPN